MCELGLLNIEVVAVWAGFTEYRGDGCVSWVYWISRWWLCELGLLNIEVVAVWAGFTEYRGGGCVSWFYWISRWWMCEVGLLNIEVVDWWAQFTEYRGRWWSNGLPFMAMITSQIYKQHGLLPLLEHRWLHMLVYNEVIHIDYTYRRRLYS